MTMQADDILLVEDNPSDADLTIHALKKHTQADRIELARDGAEALDILFRKDAHAVRAGEPYPKVILLDLKLPKIDGLEVLRRMKADARTRHIPVVILTSSREESDLQEAYRLGANSYIVKPVEFDNFTEVVAKLGYYWLVVNQHPPVPQGAAK